MSGKTPLNNIYDYVLESLRDGSFDQEGIYVVSWDFNVLWDWHALSKNRNVTWEDIKRYTDHFNSDYPGSYNKIDNTWIKHWCISYTVYGTETYKRQLAVETSSKIFAKLIAKACHPTRHPANYLPIDELVDHPYKNLTQEDLKIMYGSTKNIVN